MSDERDRKEYDTAELVTACLMMFLLKEGSRNAMNNERKEAKFVNNYFRLFKMGLPHMDTVEDFLRVLNEGELEQLKATLVSGLIERRVFHKFKLLGRRFIVAVDGTGVASYDDDYCGECLHKSYKSGKTVYFQNVLEAKLVTSNGLAISLATEWIYNDSERDFNKQDCEHKAFKRLAVKLKQYFPRLPICITADGLYPNQYFFTICEQNNWDFIIVLQDGNLPSLQEEIRLLPKPDQYALERYIVKGGKRITQQYRWANDLEYKGHTLSWIECNEETITTNTGKQASKRFVHITNLKIDRETAFRTSTGGRLRWKIENEGFNVQKNQGYQMEHKYSRSSFKALKNYFQCLQIAHMINQLVVLSSEIAVLFIEDKKMTVIHLWKCLIGFLQNDQIIEMELDHIREKRWQIRLAN
ncbi:MAG: hypothetical protein KAQ62_17690 [Cyclobacteriaceae bacterium]|nr:hypothetical protein [Cyclobacteriaceae bacterium]MCK5279354.1 hypothetical protein [Cyclobacteriaceae bacterium]MCK5370401.1 hypothetical protein [Cyclobacteriaceae bacterium]MCK5468967.1 hypothetical protein [Cyclobacteriaceae bacterium]MCK5699830.1 hypothetical protein [Cyclobacteriaceae bacterium]